MRVIYWSSATLDQDFFQEFHLSYTIDMESQSELAKGQSIAIRSDPAQQLFLHLLKICLMKCKYHPFIRLHGSGILICQSI